VVSNDAHGVIAGGALFQVTKSVRSQDVVILILQRVMTTGRSIIQS